MQLHVKVNILRLEMSKAKNALLWFQSPPHLQPHNLFFRLYAYFQVVVMRQLQICGSQR